MLLPFLVPPTPAILVLIPAPHLTHLGGGQACLDPLGAPHALLHHLLPLGGLLGRGNGVPGHLGTVLDVEMSHQKAYWLDHRNTSLPNAAISERTHGTRRLIPLLDSLETGLEERRGQSW